MRHELEKWYPALAQMRLGTFSVTALDVSAHDSAAYVRVTVSFHADGFEPWITAGVSSDMNQAALMAIVDGFNHWLMKTSGEANGLEATSLPQPQFAGVPSSTGKKKPA